MPLIEIVGLVASIILPLCNIPLIIRIIHRKSSKDVSPYWAVGVWICLVLMAPAGVMSKDFIWRTYTVINLILFTGVVITVLAYRKGCRN